MTRGVLLGKFNPLHKGHELAIRTASDLLDGLTVIVSQKDENQMHRSYNAVSELAWDLPSRNTAVYMIKDESPEPIEIDEHGTVLDEAFQEYWVSVVSAFDPTHIVSSDMYGKVLAERMGIEWLPIDPDREMVPISGTEIRGNLDSNFSWISDYAKFQFRKTFAVVGAESVGKSTLVKKVASLLDIPMVNEYGRTISEAKDNNLTEKDFDNIARGQINLIRNAVQLNPDVRNIIVDTENITTYMYGKVYLEKKLKHILRMNAPIDHYFVLAPNLKWVDDGTRVMPHDADRKKFHEELIQHLTTQKKSFTVVDDLSYEERIGVILRKILEVNTQQSVELYNEGK